MGKLISRLEKPSGGDVLLEGKVDSGDFVFEAKDCKTDEVQDECGNWIDDIISHVIRCKNCGQCFSSTAITYRGGGSFRKGR